MKTLSACFAIAAVLASSAWGEPPDIVSVKADKVGMGWRIAVTLRHPDSGWDHYADSWRVENAEGKIIATRELMHPHVDEQPFKRSLSAVMVPDGVRELFIRAHCSTGGWSDAIYRIEMSPDM
ncbi:hypothetical protein [Puniceibacterium sediminis]|uniref:Uncharacterized protein n=1 Tax=Puniceibacterium sediminis TaxID=1608407 RepID=A0A238VVE1_9RHOB|nr:hypothetical protein [Puniceibacterium sediminis]SNR38270.1 hypothetical protein SAMN06265370_103213 [Puniceibacterium sediminis]